MRSAFAQFSPFSQTDENRPYHNFAPFVRQIGERKAQACAKAMLRQQRERMAKPRVEQKRVRVDSALGLTICALKPRLSRFCHFFSQ